MTKVSQDQKLQAELSQAMESNTDRPAATKVAAKHGYEFSTEELGSRIEQIKSLQAKQAANAELNEEELETVAGGLCLVGLVSKLATEGLKQIGDDDELFG